MFQLSTATVRFIIYVWQSWTTMTYMPFSCNSLKMVKNNSWNMQDCFLFLCVQFAITNFCNFKELITNFYVGCYPQFCSQDMNIHTVSNIFTYPTSLAWHRLNTVMDNDNNDDVSHDFGNVIKNQTCNTSTVRTAGCPKIHSRNWFATLSRTHILYCSSHLTFTQQVPCIDFLSVIPGFLYEHQQHKWHL
jgi:hypothetical protein